MTALAHPTVSVIIPCFKQAVFLDQTVGSVIAQGFSDWEIIIVNDGSPDETSKVAHYLIGKYPASRIRLIEQSNQGLAMARNNGIVSSHGKYILPLDADDAIDPEFLSKTVATLEVDETSDIIHTNQRAFGDVNCEIETGEFSLEKLATGNQLNYCSLYRRKVFDAVGGYNPNMVWGYEDWDFWIGAAICGFRARKIEEHLFFYRIRHGSLLTRARQRDTELRARIVLNHPEIYNQASRDYAAQVWARVASEAKSIRPRAFESTCDGRFGQLSRKPVHLNGVQGTAARAVAIDPDDSKKIGLIYNHFNQQHWMECARICQDVLIKNPKNINLMVVLAECLVNLQDLGTAVDFYRNARDLNPYDAEVSGRLLDLESRLKDGPSLTPEQEVALKSGLAALENDLTTEALAHCRKAQSLGPAHPELDQIICELEVRIASATAKHELRRDLISRMPDLVPPIRPTVQERHSKSYGSVLDANVGSFSGTFGGPLISVVLPTFNRPGLLTECLDGFARQSVPTDQFEIVIVDDGSEPPVKDIADSFANRLRIRYHYQPNAGLAAARNQAIMLASAQWVALHDDDDVPGRNYLEGCIDFHRKYPAVTDILLARVAPSPSLSVTPLLEWTFDARNGVIGFPESGGWHGFTRFYGGTSSCKRALFRHGLYDPEYRFGYEDMELAFRLNQKLPLRVEYHPEVFSHLIRSPDFPGTFRRLYREGRSLRRFFHQQGEPSFSVIPPEFRNCSEWVGQLEPWIPKFVELIRQLETPGDGGKISITIDSRRLTGDEALKGTYSLCAKFARGRGWLDFGSGLDEKSGLDRIQKTLRAYA